MQLERFNSFVQQLQRDTALGQFGNITGIYRRTGEQWLDPQGVPQTDQTLTDILTRVCNDNIYWRKSKSRCAYFPVSQLDTVVAVTCDTPPRIRTQDKIQTILSNALKHSNDEFDANHDQLTGLLNGRSMETALQRIASSPSPPTSADELRITSTAALIALDLDHFKQVNDSYGHDYGDIVLRCFAKRLHNVLAEIQSAYEHLDLLAGRMGGEEFAVIIDGVTSPENAKSIAEQIRLAYSGPLPTDGEWEEISPGLAAGSLSLPPIAERNITVSVGLSSLATASARSQTTMLELKREADEALYRAKAGGRNTVRWFPEIRDKFGSVLEYHDETNVVVVDIGSQLNVRKGDEFLVYHPDFTGEKPFVFSDGRTKKQLGTYPKISCGRVIVFDAQPGIAFCKIADKAVPRFPIGSSLEYIPVGSIAHLIVTDSNLGMPPGLPLVPSTTLEATIKGSKDSKLSVIVFRLSEAKNLERTRGVVFINRALAGLFEAIRSIIPRNALIGQLQSDTLAVVITTGMDAVKAAHDVIASARSRCGDAATFVAGLFDSKKGDTIPGDKSNLDRQNALDFARYAALPDAQTQHHTVQRFNPTTAIRILAAQRDSKRYREARADYDAFKSLGLTYSEIENQMGLMELLDDNWDTALTFFNRAAELEPLNPAIQYNRAFTEFILGNAIRSYSIFSEVLKRDPIIPPVYLHAVALSAYAQFQSDPTSIQSDQVIKLLKEAQKNGTNVSFYGIRKENVDDALTAMLQLASPASKIASEEQ
jgi:diguanylate cyclase (GGDEF)-like protein